MSSLDDFTAEQLRAIMGNIHKLPVHEQAETLSLLEELVDRKEAVTAKDSLLAFAHRVAPILQIETEPKVFMVGPHHKQLAKLMDAVARGEKRRILISVAPRFGKSLVSSYLFPAWYLGKFPNRRIIMASHTGDMATGFGRKVRDLINTPEYRTVFPEVELKADSKAAGQWSTNKGGEYYAVGVGGALAGRGANLCCHPESIVETKRGSIPLQEVCIGDYVLGREGWAEVKHIISSQHMQTVHINKILQLSAEHPMWVVGKGWVAAEEIKIGDYLLKVSLLGRIRIIVNQWRNHEQPSKQDPRVQHLGNDAAAMHESQSKELHKLWGQGYNGLRTVARVFFIHIRSWFSPLQQAHTGSDRQQQGVHTRQLPLGRCGDTTKQSNKWSTHNRVWGNIITSAVGPQNWIVGRSSNTSDKGYEDAPRGSTTGTKDELGTARSSPANYGGSRTSSVPLECGSQKSFWRRGLERIIRACAQCLWVQVEVRSLQVENHTPRSFLNLHVGLDNTFVVDSYMGHNCVIDDPFSEQIIMAGNTDVFDDAWAWFQTGPLQRLAPDGACIIIHCMTGDTQVLLPDGTEKNLRDIKVGEIIATYDNGQINKAKVLNWKNQGPDCVLAIKMRSGIIVRANKRHPFLVQRGSKTEWIKVQNLKVGEHILRVSGEKIKGNNAQLKGAETPRDPEACVTHTIPKLVGRQESDPLRRNQWLLRRSFQQVSGGSTKALSAPLMDAGYKPQLKGCVHRIIIKLVGLLEYVRRHITQSQKGTTISATGTGLVSQSTTLCSQHKTVYAPYVGSPLEVTCASTGVRSFASIMIMTLERFAASCAMTATSLLGMVRPKKYCLPQQSTYEIIPDEILSITEDGIEDVFDIQVEGTENFVANGLISHNTRWNKGDLIGRLQTQMAKNPEAEQWDVVEFPAILNAGTDHEKSLWPERWPLEALLQKKANMAPQYWQAQYMQSPTSEAGAMIKREWWNEWDREDPPHCEYVIMSLDAAQEAHNRADYNACQVWGVFYEETGRGAPVANIILLDAWKKRMEYPELKKAMIDEYEKWEPDTFVIEKKSSGSVLYQELRHAGVPVSEFTPGKGNDKIARVNSVSDIFSSGLVWAPTDRRWAMEVVEECSDFPNGEHDDQVDAMTLAIRRFRTGGFIRLPTDEQDEESMYPRKHKYY